MVRFWPSGSGFGFGLTMPEDGGFDEVAEFFRAAAICSPNRRTSVSRAATRVAISWQCGHGFGGGFIKSVYPIRPEKASSVRERRRIFFVIMRALREHGLRDTPMAEARCDTIRARLFKVAARITVSVRRVVVSMSEFCVVSVVFGRVLANLRALATRPAPVPGTC